MGYGKWEYQWNVQNRFFFVLSSIFVSVSLELHYAVTVH